MSAVSVVIDPKVINKAYLPDLDNMARTQIYFGGSSSGKSVFLAQRDLIDVMKGGRNFLVCRQVGRTLRGSVIQELTKLISDWNLTQLFSINKTDGTITCNNGYQIVFAGLDDVEKIKSITPAKGVFTDIRIEEATETSFATVKQLSKRLRGGSQRVPKRLVMSFNPILKSHWIFESYFKPLGWTDNQTKFANGFLTIRKTTYKDNAFLTPDDIQSLENETDKYFYDVYTLGNWGSLGHVILTNWRAEDLKPKIDEFTNRRHGLDFGFADDPAAFVNIHYDRMRKIIYVYREFKAPGLMNDELATIIIEHIGKELITCDSAEPKSIAELKSYGVNAEPTIKGKDSVLHGIQWLRQHTIIVDLSCIGLINELQQYHWKEDSAGNALPIPVDAFNHLIDAIRYALFRDMKPVKKQAKSHSGY